MNDSPKRLYRVGRWSLLAVAVACGVAAADDSAGPRPGSQGLPLVAGSTAPDSLPLLGEPPFRDIVGDPFRFDFDQSPEDRAGDVKQTFDAAEDPLLFWDNYQPPDLPTGEGDLIYQDVDFFAVPRIKPVPQPAASPWLLAAGALLSGMMLVLAARAAGRSMTLFEN